MTTYFIETKIPNVDDFLALDVEAVAQLLLADLANSDKPVSLYLYLYVRFDQPETTNTPRLYGDVRRDEVKAAIAETWGWLTNQGLLVPDPTNDKGNSQIIARQARDLSTPKAFEAYRLAASIPRDLFHSVLREEVRSDLMRGRYDVAVFQAFKEVEVAVCKAAGFDSGEKYSTGLLNAAFGTANGKLVDPEASETERKARLNLFSGAIGSYKNPLSHRHLNIETLHEAVELVMVASHLLGIVDRIKRDRELAVWAEGAENLARAAKEAAASMVTKSCAKPAKITWGGSTVPSRCVIKGNVSSKCNRIYHMAGQQDYEKTGINTGRDERWFCTAGEAESAGQRAARR